MQAALPNLVGPKEGQTSNAMETIKQETPDADVD
jgi:hypothetical protein